MRIKGNNLQLKEFLIVKQILLLNALKNYREQNGEYAS